MERKFTMAEVQDVNRRAMVLDRMQAKEISLQEASARLGVSERQVFRLLSRYKDNGVKGLIHGNKLHPTNTGYDNVFKEQVVATYLGAYQDYNFSHFMDKLQEDYNLKLSLSFIRSTLMAHGIISPRKHRHKRTPHPPRERKANAGELVQADASEFQWLSYLGDSKYYYLHGMIDDTTGIVVALWLEEQETNHGYQMCMKQMIKNYGIPAWLYTDNRSTFSNNNQKLTTEEMIEAELNGTEDKDINQTRFVEMLKRLGVGIITTSVPQAKGRIERLWNTLQDRLPKELRDHSVTNIKEANQYIINDFLPRYNKQFASTINCNRNYFQKVQKDFNYNRELALIYKKRIYNGTYLQLDKQYYTPFLNGKNVKLNARTRLTIYCCLNGNLGIFYNHKWYDLKPINSLTRRNLEQGLGQTPIASSLTLSPLQETTQKANPITKPKLTPEELSLLRSKAARKANTPWRHTNHDLFVSTDKAQKQFTDIV